MAAPSLIKPLSIMSMAATAATMLEGVYRNTTAEIVVTAEAKRGEKYRKVRTTKGTITRVIVTSRPAPNVST